MQGIEVGDILTSGPEVLVSTGAIAVTMHLIGYIIVNFFRLDGRSAITGGSFSDILNLSGRKNFAYVFSPCGKCPIPMQPWGGNFEASNL